MGQRPGRISCSESAVLISLLVRFAKKAQYSGLSFCFLLGVMALRIIVDEQRWQHNNHILISLRNQHSLSPYSPVVWNHPLVCCPSTAGAIQPFVPIPVRHHSGQKLADSIQTTFHSIGKYRERLIESPYPAQRLSPSHVIPQLRSGMTLIRSLDCLIFSIWRNLPCAIDNNLWYTKTEYVTI